VLARIIHRRIFKETCYGRVVPGPSFLNIDLYLAGDGKRGLLLKKRAGVGYAKRVFLLTVFPIGSVL